MSFIDNIFKKIFNHEAIIVVIKGFWKHGKTNVGLKIVEHLFELGIIQIAGTNIKIKETDKIKYVEDFETLKEFHYDHPRNPKHKAFIFDEAGKLAGKRRAMNKVNVGWMEFIPELSKGRMKLIVITQAQFLTDSIFVDTQFTKAIITAHKHGESNYSISIESELLDYPIVHINKFPKCITKYSPYESAEWFIEKRIKEERLLLCCIVARLYGIENKSSNKIMLELNLRSRLEVMNLLKRHIKHTFQTLEDEDLIEIAKERGYSLKTINSS